MLMMHAQPAPSCPANRPILMLRTPFRRHLQSAHVIGLHLVRELEGDDPASSDLRFSTRSPEAGPQAAGIRRRTRKKRHGWRVSGAQPSGEHHEIWNVCIGCKKHPTLWLWVPTLDSRIISADPGPKGGVCPRSRGVRAKGMWAARR